MRLNTKKSHAEVHKHRNVQHRRWSEVMELDLIIIKKPIYKITQRHGETVFKERGK